MAQEPLEFDGILKVKGLFEGKEVSTSTSWPKNLVDPAAFHTSVWRRGTCSRDSTHQGLGASGAYDNPTPFASLS